MSKVLAVLGKCDSFAKMIHLTKIAGLSHINFMFDEDGLTVLTASMFILKIKKEEFEEYHCREQLGFRIENKLEYESSSPYLIISYGDEFCFSFEVNGYNVSINIPFIYHKVESYDEITPMFIVRKYQKIHTLLKGCGLLHFKSVDGRVKITSVSNGKQVEVCLHNFIKDHADFTTSYRMELINRFIQIDDIDAFFTPGYPLVIDFKVEKGILHYLILPCD